MQTVAQAQLDSRRRAMGSESRLPSRATGPGRRARAPARAAVEVQNIVDRRAECSQSGLHLLHPQVALLGERGPASNPANNSRLPSGLRISCARIDAISASACSRRNFSRSSHHALWRRLHRAE